MPTSHTLTLPQIRVADIEVLKPVKALEDHVPGYRYSATFLSSLRSNLHLSAASFPISPSSSLPATPLSPAFPAPSSGVTGGSFTAQVKRKHHAGGSQKLNRDNLARSGKSAATGIVKSDQPRSSRGHQAPSNNTVPGLKFTVLQSDDIVDRIAALKLVADSVAEQRQVAFVSIITNRTLLFLLVVSLTSTYRMVSYAMFSAIAVTSIATLLLGSWIATGEYETHSNELDLDWLRAGGRPSLASSTNPRSVATTQHQRNNSISSIASSSSSGSSTSSANPSQNGQGNHANSNNDPTVMVVKSPASATASSSTPYSHQLPRSKPPPRQSAKVSTQAEQQQQQQQQQIVGVVIMKYTKRTRTAHIRAWTVARAHRSQGLGTELLEQSVRHMWTRGARSVEIDASHANSKRLQSLARLAMIWSRSVHFLRTRVLQFLGGAAAAATLTESSLPSSTLTSTASTAGSRRRSSASSNPNTLVSSQRSTNNGDADLLARDMNNSAFPPNTNSSSSSSTVDTTAVSGDATLLLRLSRHQVLKPYGFPHFERCLDDREEEARETLRDIVARVRREGGGGSSSGKTR